MEEKAKKDSQSSPQAQPQAQPGQNRILPAPTLNMSGVHGGVTSTNPLWWHSRLYNELGPLGSNEIIKDIHFIIIIFVIISNFFVNFCISYAILNIKINHFRSWARCTVVQLPA